MPSTSAFIVQLDPGFMATVAAVLFALVGAVLLAVAIACCASVAGMCMDGRGRTRAQLGAWPALLALSLLGGTRVAAQSRPGEQIPTVAPPLSRLYGSDSLDFSGLFVSGAISPDGRWLVYSRAETETATPEGGRMNLWIVPLDGSRDATRLTTGAYWDANPLWFPSGDRVLFRSSRPDLQGDFQYLVTLDIDPATGTTRSVPRQITLEPVPFMWSYGISPDGRQVAYVPRPTDPWRDEFMLKVLPSTGGRARIVWRQREPIYRPVWADDGFLYFVSTVATAPNVSIDPRNAVRRVPADGGEAETLSTWPDRARLSADARTILYLSAPPGSGTESFTLATVRGRRLASFALPENMSLSTCFARGVAECLATTEDVAAPLKVLPVNGGPSRQLTESRGMSWPQGWTPDGHDVLVGSEIDGTRLLMSMPLRGGVARELYRQSPEETAYGRSVAAWVYGPSVKDGRYVLYGAKDGPDGTLVLKILDLQSGSEREISRSPWDSFTHFNSSQSGDRFVYAERKGGRFEFRAVRPEGEPTLLRAFPDTAFPPIIGVHGDRIAWWVESEGRSTLYLAREGSPEARKVLTFQGSVGQRGSSAPVWSPDGRHLATGYHRLETNEADVLMVEFDDSGNAVGDPRVIEDLPESWWSFGWMPPSDAFLVVDGNDVWLKSLDGAPPVNLTADEPGQIWTYALSPDGRYLAVAPQVRRGGSIWRLDLEEVLAKVGGEREGS